MSGYMKCHENIVQSVDVSSSNRWPTDDSDHSLLDMDSPAIGNSNLSIPHTYETRKKFPLGDEDIKTDSTAWTHKPIWQWNKEDTIHWLISAASDLGQSYGSIRTSLTLPGERLITLTRKQFISLDPEYGEKLYNLLQLQHNSHSLSVSYSDTISSPSDDELLHLHSSISDVESDNSIEVSSKRPPGRPRLLKPKKSPNKSQGKLWEFIRDLLLNRETCPSLICWEDYSQAKFRFVKSDEVAKLWGARKGNKKMSYEKLSRAMRYYYKSKIFLPVLGKRLVYQFGPNAKGWQTDNPNFLP